jgi:putative membrane protein
MRLILVVRNLGPAAIATVATIALHGAYGAEPGATGAQLTDAQIAAIAVTANKVDIDAARVAQRKSKNAEVKRFAADMIRDHTSANKQAAALAKKLKLKPQPNDTSRSLATGGQQNLKKLKSLKGKEFDRAYIDQEVTYHQNVLDALDQKLIPAAQNADLKSLLQSVRSVVAQHLDHAKTVAQSLSK